MTLSSLSCEDCILDDGGGNWDDSSDLRMTVSSLMWRQHSRIIIIRLRTNTVYWNTWRWCETDTTATGGECLWSRTTQWRLRLRRGAGKTPRCTRIQLRSRNFQRCSGLVEIPVSLLLFLGEESKFHLKLSPVSLQYGHLLSKLITLFVVMYVLCSLSSQLFVFHLLLFVRNLLPKLCNSGETKFFA